MLFYLRIIGFEQQIMLPKYDRVCKHVEVIRSHCNLGLFLCASLSWMKHNLSPINKPFQTSYRIEIIVSSLLHYTAKLNWYKSVDWQFFLLGISLLVRFQRRIERCRAYSLNWLCLISQLQRSLFQTFYSFLYICKCWIFCLDENMQRSMWSFCWWFSKLANALTKETRWLLFRFFDLSRQLSSRVFSCGHLEFCVLVY